MKKLYKIISILLFLTVSLSAESIKDDFVKLILNKFTQTQLKQISMHYGLQTNGNTEELKLRLLQKMNLTNIAFFSNSISSNQNQTNSLSKPLVIKHADAVKYFTLHQVNEDVIIIIGGILEYENMQLKADRLAVNLKTKQVYGDGHIFFIENGKIMVGDGFYYDAQQKHGIVYKGRSVVGKILYVGNEIKTLDTDFYKIKNALFSTCHLENPHYELEAQKLWIYPDKTFLLLNLFYSVGGIRLFYFPFAFTTKKGTGIHSYGGYSSKNGYFIQNTYNYNLSTFNGKLKFDYYQFKGLYGGITIRNKTDRFNTDLSVNVAQDSELLNNEKRFRWLHSFSENILLNKTDTGYTKLSGYYFDSSDNVFNYDYLQNRVTKSGIALDSLNLLKKTYEPFSIYQNSYSINLTDVHKPSSFSITTKWNVQWNNALQKYTIYRIQLPTLRYSISQDLIKFSVIKGDSIIKKGISFLFNNLKWNLNAQFDNSQFYDINTEQYTKTEIYRDVSSGVSKTFNFFSVFTYSPRISLGNKNKIGKDISASEEYNFALQSYNYLSLSEAYRLNFHKIIPIKSYSSYLSVNRTLYYRLLSNINSEYGNVQSHSLSAGYYFTLPKFSYSIRTYANLLTKTNEVLNFFDANRYNNLEQKFTFKPFSFLNLNDNYSYSVKESKPVINRLYINLYKTHPIVLPVGVIDSIRWNINHSYNFQNLISSYLRSAFSMKFRFKYFELTFSTTSKNRKLFVYSKENLKSLGMSDQLYRNFFSDLIDSFNFFDIEKRKRTYFKLESISVSVNHDLHCWELVGGYSLRQLQTYYPYDTRISYPYWEHSLWLQIQLKDFTSVKYKKDTKTTPPEWE